MKVSYKSVTGELLRLEKSKEMMGFALAINANPLSAKPTYNYDLDIFDIEKECKISFTGVKLKDIKFLNSTASFVE